MSQALLDRYWEQMLADIPLKWFGKPEEIQGVLLFLASQAAAYSGSQKG